MANSKAKTSRQNSRPSLFDSFNELERTHESNKYCDRTTLRDEASVESFFVNRLLKDLGYDDVETRLKESLESIAVSRGRKKEQFKPDFVLVCGDKPRWVIDAKAPSENVDDWAYQGAGYAHGLNKRFTGENPCQYYSITNGNVFNVYRWDENDPVLSLSFDEFVDDSPSYVALRQLLEAKKARTGWQESSKSKTPSMTLRKAPIEEVKRIFNTCHQLIWKTEKMNPQPAFFEFVKIMFLKLLEDKRLHDHAVYGPLLQDEQPIPKSAVIFSNNWIENLQSTGVANPVDDILFKHLLEELSDAVLRRNKKPIFDPDEKIRLQTGTIKQVVAKLESVYLFGIDEDLNGRLFETFLNAIMRGQSLGQYFTPRSIAKLITRLANPVANSVHIDKVLDACCGTGGFLIEALTDMRNLLRANDSLSDEEFKILMEKLANESLFGVDAGREPPVARIARINMYLHGDGGSRIYAADSLDKTATTGVEDDRQSRLELEEWRNLCSQIQTDNNHQVNADKHNGFDIVLSNPPFSMGYSDAADKEAEILQSYELARIEGTSKFRPSLTSNIMFIERYAELLKPGGKLLTVIDDSVLSSPKMRFARDFIRKHFIIRAVISLPGDAFQKVGARAKTSVLYLTKRRSSEKTQPNIFMTECQYVGLDDVPSKTRPSVAIAARKKAEEEMKRVLSDFDSFNKGEKGDWVVSSANISDRLDVKSCLPRTHDIVKDWKQQGLEILAMSDVVDVVQGPYLNPSESPLEELTFLRVTYDGAAEEGEKAVGGELTYSELQQPQAGDIVCSNIAIGLGSTCVIPSNMKPAFVSHEFTVMRLKDTRFNVWFLWSYLRSTEVRARLLSGSSGTNRQRVGWDDLKDLPVPLVKRDIQNQIGLKYESVFNSIRQAKLDREQATTELSQLLNLDNDWAVKRLKTAKPPK